MPFNKRKVDKNQGLITRQLRDLDISVQPIHTVGHGVPDLLIGVGGITILIELKSDKKSPFTKDELEWMELWKGQVDGAVTLQDCLRVIIRNLDRYYSQEAIREMYRLKGILNGLEKKSS
jgi:hypothetical protein